MSPSRATAQLTAAVLSLFCAQRMAAAQGTPNPDRPVATATPDQPAAEGAQAQETAGAEPATPTRGKRRGGEEIVVTGSRIRRKDLTTPAPITVISKEQVQSSGRVSIGDFLQAMPEQGNAINTSVNNGGTGATRISLRGLGVARTLVLLNGRRFVPGGFGNAGTDASVDLNAIPAAAIERIEVLKDGASAVYGSDAIGGVINLITRKTLNGAEISGYAGTSTHSDGQTYDINFTGGTTGERGNLLFSGGFYTQKTVWGGDRAFARIPLSYDGVGALTTSGKPGPYSQGSTTVPAGTIVLPTSQAGKVLPNPNNDPRIAFYNRLVTQNPSTTAFIRDPGAANSICLAGSTTDCWRPFTSALLPEDGGDGYNFMPDNYLVTPQQRISLYSIGDIRLGEGARGYFEGSYVNRQSAINLAAEPYLSDSENMTISKDNIYNPFGRDFTTGPGTPASTAGAVRKRLLEFGTRYTKSDIDTFRIVAGLDGSLPEAAGPLNGWVWDISLNYGRTTSTVVKQGNLNKVAMQQALGPSDRDGHCLDATGAIIDGCVPLNLFGGPSSITPDQIANLQYTGTLRGTNQLTAAQFTVSGELFKLFADRPVGLAAGYEYRIYSGENIPDPITVAGETTGNKADITRGHYYVNEGYGELSIPVIGGLPFIQDLEATAAIRVFDYNTFGSDYTYKLGGRWRVIPDFTFRGTYSTGFRAPSVAELYQGQSDAFPNVQDPCRGLGVAGGGAPPATCGDAANNGDAQTQLRSRVGGNANLKPETAKIFTAGIVIEPRYIKNFTLTADYYNITIDNLLAPIGASTILNACYLGDPATAQRYCDLIQRDPSTQKILNIINLTTNAGQDKTDGIDLALRYDLPTEVGRWGFLFDGTWLHQFNRTLADGTVVRARGTFDLATTGAVLPAFKFVAGLRWALSGFGAGVNTRFVGSFRECGTSSGNFAGSGQCYVNDTYQRHVDAYNTWDVFLSYVFNSPFGKTTVAAGVNNVFNKDPAIIYNGFTAASDPTAYADGFMGRFFYTRLGHAF